MIHLAGPPIQTNAAMFALHVAADRRASFAHGRRSHLEGLAMSPFTSEGPKWAKRLAVQAARAAYDRPLGATQGAYEVQAGVLVVYSTALSPADRPARDRGVSRMCDLLRQRGAEVVAAAAYPPSDDTSAAVVLLLP